MALQYYFAFAIVVFAVILALPHRTPGVRSAEEGDAGAGAIGGGGAGGGAGAGAALTVAARVRQAQALFARGRAKDGAALLRMAAEHGGGNARLYFMLAYLQSTQPGDGSNEAARATYSELLRRWPRHTDAMQNLAVLENAAGNTTGAARLYQRCLRLEPARASAHYNLGKIEVEADHEAGLRSFARAIALDPTHTKALSLHGFHSQRAGRARDALRSYTQAAAAEAAAGRAAGAAAQEALCEAVRGHLQLGSAPAARGVLRRGGLREDLAWPFRAAILAHPPAAPESLARARSLYRRHLVRLCGRGNPRGCAAFITQVLNRGVCNRLDWQLDDKAQLELLLRHMRARHGDRLWDIHPATFVMPADAARFQRAWDADADADAGAGAGAGADADAADSGNLPAHWLKKWTWGGRGQGAALLNRSTDGAGLGTGHVVQRYVRDPLLLDGGLKFDLRIWVTVASLEPLRVFVYRRCYAKTAVKPYSAANGTFESHFTMTWVPVGEEKEKEKEKRRCGYRSHEDVLRACDRQGGRGSGQRVWTAIKRVGLMAVLAAASRPAQRPCAFDRATGEHGCAAFCAYKTYAIDLMVDRALKPWLIEVNDNPGLSFQDCDAVPAPVDWGRVAADLVDLPTRELHVDERDRVEVAVDAEAGVVGMEDDEDVVSDNATAEGRRQNRRRELRQALRDVVVGPTCNFELLYPHGEAGLGLEHLPLPQTPADRQQRRALREAPADIRALLPAFAGATASAVANK